MPKKVLFGDEARNLMIKGVNIVGDAVCTTYGPRGTNVIFDEGYSVVTKDGVTVAQQISLKDKFENLGATMAKEAAERTNSVAGDGTTGTVAILQSIVNEGNKYIVSGMNPILIKRGMDKTLSSVIENLNKYSKKIDTREDKINIATISSNNDKELGTMIVDVIDKVGKNGVVTVTTNNSFKTEVEYVDGTKIDSGFESSIFINEQKRLTANYSEPTIIITSDEINLQNQLVPLIQKLLREGKREMVLFASKIEGQALAFLIQNYIQGKFVCVPVQLPSFGGYQKDIMNDFATLVEATVIGKNEGIKLEDAEVSVTGSCSDIIISRDSTIVSGGKGDISKRIEEVQALIDGEKDAFRLEKLKERLGKLTGKIANIKVGGASNTEQSEIKYRIEDALNATKAAIEDGVVEGAGTALLRCSDLIEIPTGDREMAAGAEIIKTATKAPFRKIIMNGGENADAILGKVLDGDKSYNSLTQKYENLFETGIIDPKKVIENEVINAVATAGILLTSSVAIVDDVEEK